MKKLLLVLSVVAMASFLLVGCFGITPVAVTEVTLDQATMALTAGGATGTLVETVVPADATDKTVTWSSSVPAVATVVNGVVTPLTAGTTTIIVTTVDGSLTATCEVTVAAPVTPVGPTIAVIPDAIVEWDAEPWTYQVVASLGTGTTLTYSLIGNPVLMSISTTGLITWTTILDMLALHEVTVKVLDNDGLFATETFIIEVIAPLPVPPEPVGPTVDSLLPLEAIVGEAYVGQVTAIPGDAAIASYALTDPPAGMAIVAATGVVTWTPATAGNQLVTVVVTDGAGLSSDPKVFTIVVAARVKPAIAAIVVDHIHWGELFSLQVELTAGTDLTPTYALAATRVPNAIGLTISGTGLITWTPLAIQNGLYEVTVTATDTIDPSLFGTAVFTILVVDPEPPAALSATIVYAPTHSYLAPDDADFNYYVRGYTVPDDDCVPVIVTLSEAVEEDIQIRWNDGTGIFSTNAAVDDLPGWITLTGDGTVFTGCLPFDGTWDDCEIVCVEVRRYTADPCCPEIDEIIFTDIVKVDSVDPCASFVVTVEDCENLCEPFNLSISWTSECAGECDPLDCCYDYCSGVNGWEFILDASADPICDPGECDTVIGNGCVPSIEGQFGCALDCLIWADTGEVVYIIDYSISDNVGNVFTDVWTITVDTDSVISLVYDTSVTASTNADGDYIVDYDCPGAACLDCYPPD